MYSEGDLVKQKGLCLTEKISDGKFPELIKNFALDFDSRKMAILIDINAMSSIDAWHLLKGGSPNV